MAERKRRTRIKDITKAAVEAVEKTQKEILNNSKKKQTKKTTSKKTISNKKKQTNKQPTKKKASTKSKHIDKYMPNTVGDTSEMAISRVDVKSIPELNEAVQKALNIELNKMELSDEEKTKVMESASKMSMLQYNGVVMTCPADHSKCPYFTRCPFRSINKYPVGELCPLEKIIVDNKLAEYVKEMGIMPEDIPAPSIELMLSLVECDVTEMRMRSAIAEKGYTTVTTRTSRGITEEAEEIAKEFEIKDKVAKRKEQLMKSLLFTPEIKKKYKMDEAEDKAKTIDPLTALKRAKELLANPPKRIIERKDK